LARSIALTHHEKFDGPGYPNGLAGDAIPIEGRIAAISDVFDALTSNRPYKDAWATDRALNFINENSGSHFDPGLVRLFNGVFGEILLIKNAYAD
jgi:putative two-component system response regulator